MRPRYERLRASITNLAATPELQVTYLDKIFTGMTGGHSAEGYGNNELIDEVDDLLSIIDSMVEDKEISQSEFDAVKPLSDFLDQICAEADQQFWLRPALYTDARWEQLRQCARQVLLHLPDRPGGSLRHDC